VDRYNILGAIANNDLELLVRRGDETHNVRVSPTRRKPMFPLLNKDAGV
jgi:hypothetical protein